MRTNEKEALRALIDVDGRSPSARETAGLIYHVEEPEKWQIDRAYAALRQLSRKGFLHENTDQEGVRRWSLK